MGAAPPLQVRGKDFRHEKTKKKRGSYKGGEIDPSARCSYKFDSGAPGVLAGRGGELAAGMWVLHTFMLVLLAITHQLLVPFPPHGPAADDE